MNLQIKFQDNLLKFEINFLKIRKKCKLEVLGKFYFNFNNVSKKICEISKQILKRLEFL